MMAVKDKEVEKEITSGQSRRSRSRTKLYRLGCGCYSLHMRMAASTKLFLVFIIWGLLLSVCSAQAQQQVEYQLREEQPVGTIVGDLRNDTPHTTGFLLASQSDQFELDSDGIIKTKLVLDREADSQGTSWTIVVFVGGVIIPVKIEVIDINDNSPVFPQSVTTVEVTEAVQAYMTKINGVTATDADEGVFDVQGYRIVSGNIDNTFDLNVRVRDNGVYMDIIVNKTLDRETISNYTLVIEAYDGGDPRLTANTTVIIVVTDVNDNSPVFTQTSFSAAINESAPINSTILRVTATDTDEGLNGEVVFRIDRDDGFFRIDPNTGIVYLNKHLDFENSQTHDFIVLAEDSAEQPMSSEPAHVSIRVININERPPNVEVNFVQEGGLHQVSEAAINGTTLARISVTDPDDGELTNVTLTLSGGANQFEIEQASNQVYFLMVSKTASPFDREVVSSYDISIRAADRGSPPQETVVNLTIMVTDVNDNPPLFDLTVYPASIIEASEPGTQVTQVHATDLDVGSNAEISYSIVPSASGSLQSSWFDINAVSGLITTSQKVDREEASSILLEVRASDGGDSPLTSTAVVNITVTDVNDNQPIFSPETYNATIREELNISTCFLQVNATDPDQGASGQVTYSLASGLGPTPTQFSIHPRTGRVCVSSRLDRDSGVTEYNFPVKAQDGGGLMSYAFVQVVLEDINDNIPVFNSLDYRGHIEYDASQGTEVKQVMAVDRDEGEFGRVYYSIIPSTDDSTFTIHQSTGLISLAGSLDWIQKDLYTFEVTATDGGGQSSASNAQVTITVAGPDVSAPTFDAALYSYTVQENAVNAVVGRVQATHSDTGNTFPITYSLTGGDPNGYFMVNSTSGVVETRGAGPDHEMQAFALVTIQAASGIPPTYDEARINISITDVNDNSPQFRSDTDITSIPESTAKGTVIYVASATDLDSGNNGLVKYRLTSNPSNVFGIDTVSGALTLEKTVSYNDQNRYEVVIQAYDSGSSSMSTDMALTIFLEDVNDNGPVFNPGFYRVTIVENQAVSTSIIQIMATDNDRGENAHITYSLTPSEDASYFAIFPRSGWLYNRQVLDREKNSEFLLEVVASDGGTPPQNASVNIQVTVEDFNDNPPQFERSSYNFHVNENLVAGTEIGRVVAVDLDEGTNGQITYSSTQGDFVVDAAGYIRTSTSLDRETVSSYKLTVKAMDNGNPSLTSTATVYINVNDLNDNWPVFSQDGTYEASVQEEQPSGTFVAWIVATDADSGVLGNISYSLGEGSPNFMIDSSGMITTSAALNRETQDFYTLTVLAQDGGSPPKEATASVRVRVLDVNDNAPIAAQDSYVFTTLENINPPTVVGEVSASDQDAGDNGKIYYYIVDGNDLSVWEVNHSSGEIYNVREVDYEAEAHYSLTILAQDNNVPLTQSTTIDVTINVLDQNDNAPTFEQDLTFLTLEENVGVNHVLWTVSATDADSGVNGAVRYSILTPQDFFAIDEYSGTLRTIQNVDHEVNHLFVLNIQARDQATDVSQRKSSTSTVEIRVEDFNDNDPEFVSRDEAYVSEDEPVGFNVLHIIATDFDSVDNGRVGYDIESGNEDGKFSLDSVTGLLTVAHSLDHEHKREYTLTILASDHGTTPRTATQTLNIFVLDVNDQPPRFDQSSYIMNISENQSPGTYVGQVSAIDLDSGTNGEITYEIPHEIPDGKFVIDGTTGIIMTTDRLNREATDSYIVTVYAMDGAFPAHYDMASVLVFVMDENDNDPVFANPTFDLSIPENQSPSVVHNVVATDADEGLNGELEYTITSGNTDDAFSIDGITGALSTIKALDREATASYRLLITAMDKGASPRSGTTYVDVMVTDLNDKDPVFDASVYTESIPENTPVNSSILTVSASDGDDGVNGEITYTLDNATIGLFRIDPMSGEITSNGKFDYEKEKMYVFQVTATDGGLFGPRSERVQVRVAISDINDNAPVFDTIPIKSNVSQDASQGTFVTHVQALDKDTGNNGLVKYRFAEQSTAFNIDINTGIITTDTLAPNLMYYHLRVVAYDSGNPQLSSNGIVEVWIGTSSSGSLQFSQSEYIVGPSEDISNGETVLSLQATKPDQSTSTSIVYSLVSGNQNGAFTITPGNNQEGALLKVEDSAQLDYESESEIRLVVQAYLTDGASSMYGYANVLVELTDSNDNTPQFVQDRYQSKVWEVPNSDIYVTQVSATDADAGTNAAVYYEISSGNTNNAFAIDRMTGIVTTARGLDYEDLDAYQLTVVAKDGGTPQRTGTAILRIGIVDVNDNAPYFTSMGPVSISESHAVGTLVTTVTAEDPDIEPDIQYSLTSSGNPGGMFAINRFSGDITLAGSLDRETQDSYTLGIQATDTAYTATTSLLIQVSDENDNPPIFHQESYQVTLPELTPSHEAVLAVNASDADIGQNADIVYSCEDSNQAFYIDPVTGVIYTNRTMEFSMVETIILLYVTATDQGIPPLSSYVSVRIEITDVNNHSPQFTSEIYSASVSENASIGQEVASVLAEDNDSSPNNSEIDYSILSGNEEGMFHIGANSGVISVLQKLDRETTDSYTLVVMAVDSGEPQHNDTSEVVIRIDDVNDRAPVFDRVEYHASIAENATAGVNVLTVYATDDDIGYNGEIEYSIVSGSSHDLFRINQDTGVVSVKSSLDREEVGEVQLTVQASDRGVDQRLSSVILVRIDINDINEFYPYFPVLFYHKLVPENEPSGTPVFTAVAIDKDAGEFGQVTYSITNKDMPSSNGQDYFTIDPVTGEVFTAAVFDYEATKSYRFFIQAQDIGGLSVSLQTEVNITSRDDFPPEFDDQEYNFKVDEGAAVGTHIGQVTATDKDGGEDGIVVYELSHEFFEIERTNGTIRVKQPLNAGSRRRRSIVGNVLHRFARQADSVNTSKSSYALLVTASSGKPDSLYSFTSVAISVSLGAGPPAPVTGSMSSEIIIAVSVVGALILIIVLIVIVFVYKSRRDKRKAAQPDKHSVTGSLSPRSYDVTFDPVEMAPQGVVNLGMNSSAHYAHRQLYGGAVVHTNVSEPSNSASSGRGSTSMEDEEIRRINEGGVGAPKHALREKTIDSGIAQDQEDGSVSDINTPREKHMNFLNSTSVESMHVFGEEGGGEAGGGIDIGHLIYHRLDEAGAEEEDAIMDGTRLFGFSEDGHPSMAGSLSSIVNSDEELSGSYNWDYLLDWGPQFQPLAHVFAEIAKLKDDTVAKRQTDPRLQQKKSLQANVKMHPPPLLTNTPQGPIKPVAHRMVKNISMSNHSQHLPRAPVVQESAFVPAVVSPDLSPSLSPLAPGSPSLSPLVTSTGVSSQSSRVTSGNNTPQRMHYSGNGIVFAHPTANDEEIHI